MKKIELTPLEYYNFIELAKKYKILYTYAVVLGIVIIEANVELLEMLGY